MKVIITPIQAISLIFKIKLQGKKIVIAGGCFDILHPGHVTFLEKAKTYGDILIIFLESDEKIKQTKGNGRPINKQKDRAKILAALKPVDYVILLPLMKSRDYDKLVQKIHPDVIAITAGDANITLKQRAAKLVGVQVKSVCKIVNNYSTSKTLEQMRVL